MPRPGSTRFCLGLLLATAPCKAQGMHVRPASTSDEFAERAGALHLARPGSPVGATADPRNERDSVAPFVPVPEPTTIFLFGSGLIVAARLRRRRPKVT